jgi:Pyruvate phosphate dikinase, AMP/ATP-binding domain
MAPLYMTSAAATATATTPKASTNGGSVNHNRKSDPSTRPVVFSYDATNYGQGPMIPALVPFGGSSHRIVKPDKQILGGKGMGLQEMSSIGIAVPPGFTLTAPVCQIYQQTDDLPAELWEEVRSAIRRVEVDVGRAFGDPTNPLLLSCRSGAAISMPGMMDTVLNIVRTEQADVPCALLCSTCSISLTRTS